MPLKHHITLYNASSAKNTLLPPPPPRKSSDLRLNFCQSDKSNTITFSYSSFRKGFYLLCLLAVQLLICKNIFSQSCANYTVTRNTGITYTTIAGTGTSNFVWRNTTGNQNDDNRSYPVSIGFDFWYLGVRYTTFSAALNGFIDFSTSTQDGNSGGAQPYGGNYNNWFSTANGTHLALAPMYDDPWTGGGGTAPVATSIFYKVSGAAPNQVLTVEFLNFDKWPSSTGSLNYQVKVYETTGVIEFVYGTMTAGSAAFVYACGISNTWAAGGPTAVRLLTQQTANTTSFSSTAQNALSALPASNSQLIFTPPTPTAAPTGLTFTGITQTGMTLNWTDNATNEAGYVIYYSTDAVNYSFKSQVAAGSVSAPITGLLPSTTYDWKVYAVTDGNLGAALTGTQATLPAGTITSIASTSWNTTTTWDCTCIPTAGDNVVIADGTTVTLDVNGSCNSLTIGQGVSGQLTIGNDATARTLTVNTDVTVQAGATMTTGATAATHLMTMGGNLTNSGTLDLAPTGTRICNITFNKNGNQTISGAGATTNFNLITLNMGTSNANVLDITSTNFTAPANFLTLTNGTFKLSTGATVTPFTGAVTVPLSAGIWLNNAGATMSTGATVTLYGYVRASAGILNIGDATDENLTSYGGAITIDGGTVNVAGRLDRAGVTILIYFTMSAGTLTVATVGSTTAGLAPFMISETGSTFNMSGGIIIIERPGAGNLGYLNTGGTVGTVSGGTIQIGDASTPAAPTIQINSSIVVYNLVVSNGAAVTAQLVTNSLIINNNFTINTLGTFNPAGLNFTVNAPGLTTINGTFSDGTVAGTSTLQNVDLSGGTINNGAATGVVNIQNLTMPAGSGAIGRVALTVNGTTTIPAGFGLTLNSNTGIKTFVGLVTIDAGGTWLSTSVTTAGNLIFQNGITNNNSFSANIATFNTNSQDISGAGAMSFSGNVLISGAIIVSNKNTNVITMTGTLDGSVAGSTWKNDNTVGPSTLNYGPAGVTAPMVTGVLDVSTNSNTVNYNRNGAQNVKATTYWHLTLSTTGASTKTLVLAAAIVNGNFTINSPTTFDPVAQNFTANGSVYIYGTFGDSNAGGTSTLGDASLDDVDLSGGTINGSATGIMIINGTLKYPTGNGIFGRMTITVASAVTIPTPRTLTLNNNNGIKIFQSLVTIDAGATWLSTSVTTAANLIFQNGITNNNSFSANIATFNTNNNQIIGGTASLSFSGAVTITGVNVINNTTVSITANAAAQLTGTGTWTQGTNSTLNYTGTTITLPAGTGFDAQASGNTVDYNNTAANQTIFNPVSGIYFNLTLSNTSITARTKTLSAITDVNGNLTISGGNTIFSVSTFNMTVARNWTNTSTNAAPFTAGTRTVTFDGTTTQTIGGTTTTTFYNLTLNNDPLIAGDVTLSTNNYIVSNQLTMTQGNVNLNGLTLSLGTAVGTPGTLSYASGYLYGGSFRRWMGTGQYAVTNAQGHFPMGSSSGDYRPFWLGITSANLTAGGTVILSHTAVYPTTYDVASHTDASWGGGTVLQGVSQSTWNVSTGNGLTAAAATRFDIRFGGDGFGTNTLTDINASLAASTVGTFAAATNAISPIEGNRTGLIKNELDNTGGTQSFRLGSKDVAQSPLPIELLSFDAILTDQKEINTTWITASETNNDYFTVEKSTDGIHFEFVGNVNGVGNSTTPHNYSLIDHNPYTGVSYYRLKQTDFDGKFEYSNLVSIENSEKFDFKVFPNPTTNGNINLSIAGNNNEEVLIIVNDLLGREFYSQVFILNDNGNIVIVIDKLENLVPGVYNISATNDEKLYNRKIVIK